MSNNYDLPASARHRIYRDDYDEYRTERLFCNAKNLYILLDGKRIGYRDMAGVLHVLERSKHRIEIDGKFYRIRRGKAVEIPEKWLGKVTDPQTIRKRKSKRGQGKSFRAKVQRKKRKDR